MKLRNKKTGEILETARSSAVFKDRFKIYDEISNKYYVYDSLAELNEEWEDYKDEYFKFTPALLDNTIVALIVDKKTSREEAKQAMEKLKAWKRLKDKGFRFLENKTIGEYGNISYCLTYPTTSNEDKDLDLLFGGKKNE